MTQRHRLLLAIVLGYFTFGMLLNTVGTVILRAMASLAVSKAEAGWFDGFKDVTIAAVSFATAAYLPRLGIRRALLTGSAMAGLACILMRLLPSYATICLHFALIGAGFALVKVCIYTLIGLLTQDARQHASLTSLVEGGFMVGVLSVTVLFSRFVGSGLVDTSRDWLDAYWLLAGLCALLLGLVASLPASAMAAPAPPRASMLDMIRLAGLPLVLVFIFCAFTYVFIEQGIGTWLPTFNNEVLRMPQSMSVMAGSLYAGAIAAGRLGGGLLIRRWGWYAVVNASLGGLVVAIGAISWLSHQGAAQPIHDWLHAPLAAWLFLGVGLCLAPIYPTIVSVLLSASPKERHAELMGLVVIFSALGGTTGSRLTALLFARIDGATAFGLMVVPALVLGVGLALLRRQQG